MFIRVAQMALVAVLDKPTQQLLEKIDAHLVSGLDGTNGGAYSLARSLNLGGRGGINVGADGGVGLTFARRTGPELLASPTATSSLRLDTSTLGNANATVDVSQDVWQNNVAVTGADKLITMRSSTSPIPVAGQEVAVISAGLGNKSMIIQREDGVPIVTLSNATLWSAAVMVFAGPNWKLKSASAGAVAGAAA